MTRSLYTYARVLLISCAARIVFTKMKANSYASLATYLKRTSIRLLPTDGTSRASAKWHLAAVRSMDRRRIFELGCCGIDSGVDTDHSAAMSGVVRALPVFGATAGWLGQLFAELLAATSDLADKALKPFRIAWYTPSSICRDGWAKSSAGSGIGAIWFAG